MNSRSTLSASPVVKSEDICSQEHFSWAAIIRCSSASCQLEVQQFKAGKFTLGFNPIYGPFDIEAAEAASRAHVEHMPLQHKSSTDDTSMSRHSWEDQGIRSEASTPPRTTISSLPEELRQEIISYLDYNDAWSLKQTSRLFLKVVEIPTIASFLSLPYGPSLSMLEDWEIIPLGYEACWYCRRLLPSDRFSRFQRHLTSARQHSLNFDYQSWKPEKHFCIDCGLKHGQYEPGERIFTGFGDPGCTAESVQSCSSCGVLSEFKLLACESCGACKICMNATRFAKDEDSVSFAKLMRIHKSNTKTCSGRKILHGALLTYVSANAEINRSGFVREPHPRTYRYVFFS